MVTRCLRCLTALAFLVAARADVASMLQVQTGLEQSDWNCHDQDDDLMKIQVVEAFCEIVGMTVSSSHTFSGETYAALLQTKRSMTASEAQRVVQLLDEDDDGVVTWAEWVELSYGDKTLLKKQQILDAEVLSKGPVDRFLRVEVGNQSAATGVDCQDKAVDTCTRAYCDMFPGRPPVAPSEMRRPIFFLFWFGISPHHCKKPDCQTFFGGLSVAGLSTDSPDQKKLWTNYLNIDQNNDGRIEFSHEWVSACRRVERPDLQHVEKARFACAEAAAEPAANECSRYLHPELNHPVWQGFDARIATVKIWQKKCRLATQRYVADQAKLLHDCATNDRACKQTFTVTQIEMQAISHIESNLTLAKGQAEAACDALEGALHRTRELIAEAASASHNAVAFGFVMGELATKRTTVTAVDTRSTRERGIVGARLSIWQLENEYNCQMSGDFSGAKKSTKVLMEEAEEALKQDGPENVSQGP